MTFDEAVQALNEANLSVEAKDALGGIVAGAKERGEFTDEEKAAVLSILDLEAKLLGIQADALDAATAEYELLAEELYETASKTLVDLDAFVEELKQDKRV